MRLKVIDEAMPAPARWAMRQAMGQVPAPLLMFRYRRRFFMEHLMRLYRDKPAWCVHWSRGEFETFIAFISRLNECHF